MSLSNADTYGHRARHATSVADVGDNVYRAVEELIRAIRDLEDRVQHLETRLR